LAGEWATQYRIVFDYDLFDALTGLISADTVLATCHPNRTLSEFDLPRDPAQPGFWVHPSDPDRQRSQINRLINQATAAGADIVVLPELCLTESLAMELHGWVRRTDGPRLLVAGSYHHQDGAGGTARRRNTAVAWARGHDQPLIHDKHSPADRPIIEDIQPDGWPTVRVYVTADGWHLVIAICRDLLNPHAVHALTEAGANLVLVPAMSETLVPFGGPAAQLVGAGQALVAIANNPADWSQGRGPVPARPASALFGHPGLGQQTRFVHPPDPEPGVATLAVRSAQIGWHAQDGKAPGHPRQPDDQPPPPTATPEWVTHLADGTRRQGPLGHGVSGPVTLRPAAVLVLMTDGATGPAVVLTERAPDLGDYPGQLVFPGGASDPHDDGPVATARREACEEIGLDPDTVQIIGVLAPLALPDTGFLVTPVLGWSPRPTYTGSVNLAEVTSIHQLPLRDLTASARACRDHDAERAAALPPVATVGAMTASVIDQVLAILATAAPQPQPNPASSAGASAKERIPAASRRGSHTRPPHGDGHTATPTAAVNGLDQPTPDIPPAGMGLGPDPGGSSAPDALPARQSTVT
jgi:8-oxo-dGTP pyrophosphatase MutT (NUDIX family)